MKTIILMFFSVCCLGQINPDNILIARDSWGVPHIFGNTDPEVAYGLAFANAEDDFKTMQQTLLIAKGKMGRLYGKKGAAADYAVELLGCRKIVEQKYESDLSPEFKAYIDGYVEGVNAYAKKFPKQVLIKNTFPITKIDYLTSITFSLCIISGADRELNRIISGKVKTIPEYETAGSNAFAISSNKTTDGKTYLNINPHQPLEGPAAWYEAHLISKEGLNILGGMFAGAPCVGLGVNENLGWAHTVNYPDRIDTYQLEMHKTRKNEYRYDDEWLKLEERTIKLKVKIAGIIIPVKKKIHWSKYGATVVSKTGTFALRLGANQDIRGMEQWYRMSKAKNFSEFYKAMQMVALPMFNTVYADKSDTIFYVSTGKIPIRNPEYDWKTTLPGNTSKTLTTEFHPLKDLPQYLNPKSGYLYNTNHSPFIATADSENLNPKDFDQTMNYETLENNRSERFKELIKQHDKISYEDFKKIKYDNQLPENLKFPINIDALFKLKSVENPDLKELIERLQTWDRKTDINSKGAGAFLILFNILREKKSSDTKAISEEEFIIAIRETKAYMLKHFNSTEIVLGDYQKLVRGNLEKPMWGMPDVLTASHGKPFKDGKIKVEQGESYICLARFSKEGLPEIETMISYGNSTNPESEHFADQMELYIQEKPKTMTLDKDLVLKNAVKVYSPK